MIKQTMGIKKTIINDDISPNLVLEAFAELTETIAAFDQQLSLSQLSISLPPEIENHNIQACALNFVRKLYTDIWHKDQHDGRRTQSCYGLVGAEASVISSAERVNQAKDLFRKTIAQINKTDLAFVQHQLNKRSGKIAALLNTEGLGRLHLKQCYRHIPILVSRPEKVRFSWYSSGRSITRLSVDDAMNMLLKLDTSQSHIVQQIEKLSRINSSTMLARIQTQAPVIRANMAWSLPDKTTLRAAKNCPLPLLVPLSDDDTIPEHNHISLTPPVARSRSLRSDTIIDPEPFLPSLRIHLYRNPLTNDN